jgi:hypothetical protein
VPGENVSLYTVDVVIVPSMTPLLLLLFVDVDADELLPWKERINNTSNKGRKLNGT